MRGIVRHNNGIARDSSSSLKRTDSDTDEDKQWDTRHNSCFLFTLPLALALAPAPDIPRVISIFSHMAGDNTAKIRSTTPTGLNALLS